MKLIDYARHYLSHGFSIIPIGQNKLPNWAVMPRTVEGKPTWKPFMERRATDDELQVWFASAKTTGIAVVCGNISGGLRCYDFDEKEFFNLWGTAVGGKPEMEGCLIQKTSRGYQVLVRTIVPGHNQVFACVPDENRTEGFRPVIETRGEGGYCLLPPSLHPKGHIYQWLEGYDDVATLKLILPDKLLEWDTAAERLNQVSGATTGGVREKKPRMLSLANTIIDMWNKTHNIETYLDTFGYTHMRGGGYHRPDGEKQSVYIHQMDESEGGQEVTWHWNSGDVCCGTNMHGKLHDAFDWFRITEHGGKWPEALQAAAKELGLVDETSEELVTESYQLLVGEGNSVVCTDDPELGTILHSEGANVLIGPSHSWPRQWLRAIQQWPHRFILFKELNEDVELTAVELEAKVVNIPNPIEILKMVDIEDFANMIIGAAREPAY